MRDGDGDGGVSYSSKEMFEDILKKLSALESKLHADLSVFAQRQADNTAESSRRYEKLTVDFAGFERRLALHEQLWHHIGGQAEVAKLQVDVEALLAERVAAEAVKEMLENAEQQKEAGAVQQRWLIGLVISQLLVLAGIAATLLTQHHP